MKKKVIEEPELTLQNYALKTYFKTASLMAHSLEGVSVINQGSNQESYFKAGAHIGIAFQLVDDIIDYTSTTTQLGKQHLGDLIEGNLTGPFLLTYFSSTEQQQH